MRYGRKVALLLAVALIPLGVLWRMAPLHLPLLLWKYGGSALWAAMVYWIVAIVPRWTPLQAAIASTAIAALVEVSRLHHSPALDAFRLTLAGKLLLGRIFSLRDILAYALAITLTAVLDTRLGPILPLRPSNKLN